jgi:Phytanoyl-CoA dioxygenase (PhyH)
MFSRRTPLGVAGGRFRLLTSNSGRTAVQFIVTQLEAIEVVDMKSANPHADHRQKWNDFQRELERHFAEFPVLSPKLGENEVRLEALKRDGVVFIDKLFNADEIAGLKAALKPRMQRLRAGDATLASPGHLDLTPETGRYRHYALHTVEPTALILKDHPVINDLVSAYLSNKVFFWDLALEVRCSPPNWDDAIAECNPHFDHIFREVKAYLALEDITEENGAMVYWTGTHRQGEWRKLPDYLFSIGGIWGTSHILTHIGMNQLMARSPEFADCRRIRCELKAGSVLVCDTRGIHRTSYLHSGERWQIYSTYSMEGYRRGPVDTPDWLRPLDLSDAPSSTWNFSQ